MPSRNQIVEATLRIACNFALSLHGISPVSNLGSLALARVLARDGTGRSLTTINKDSATSASCTGDRHDVQTTSGEHHDALHVQQLASSANGCAAWPYFCYCYGSSTV